MSKTTIEDRALAYYEHRMYKDGKGMPGVFHKTKEIYNPIPKCVTSIKNLSSKGLEIGVASHLQSQYEKIDAVNGLRKLSKACFKRGALYEKLYLEQLPRPEGDYINIIENSMVKKVERRAGEIVYINIEGEDETGQKVVKEYFFGEFEENEETVTKKYLLQTVNGETENISIKHMPVVELDGEYKIYPLLNKVDRINEYEQFIYSQGKANGDILLFLKKIEEIAEDDEEGEKLRETLKKKHEEITRVLSSDDEQSAAQYLEITGSIISHLESRIQDIKTWIMEEYPEIYLSKIMEGSNISEETQIMKTSDVVAKIEAMRDGFTIAIRKMLSLILGTTPDNITVSYADIIPTNSIEKARFYQELKAGGYISLSTFLEKLEELGIIGSAEEEKKALENEKKSDDFYSFKEE